MTTSPSRFQTSRQRRPHYDLRADGVQWPDGRLFRLPRQELGLRFSQPHGPKDWWPSRTFDLRTTVQVDFTQDKNQVGQAIASLVWPDFREAILFDAVLETSISSAT